jgi:hypothetical protein
LDYRITAASIKINKQSEGIIPFGLRIKWRKPEEATSYVQNNEVIVVLHKNDDIDKNIVEACVSYVPKALIPKSRNIVDPTLLESMDNYIIHKILSEGEYASAYNYFIKNILDDLKTQNTSFNNLFNSVSKIDSIGLFTRVLLEEFKKLGDLLYGSLEESSYKRETLSFVEFLFRISTRQSGDDTTPLFFSGQRIKISIILVAKYEKLIHEGIEVYTKRINKEYNKGVYRIFLFSYAQTKDQIQHDTDFVALNQIAKRCNELPNLKFLKKEIFYTKDTTGKNRTAKYYLYDCSQ